MAGKIPHDHGRALTFLAAPRSDRIDAPRVLRGPINGRNFTARVEPFLVPTLSPGDIVIMDSFGSHNGARVRRLIPWTSVCLLLPPPQEAAKTK